MAIISVIIPCFNAVPWIRETLQSIITQRLDNIEIIVVDDGSTDESAKIIKEEFPYIRLIRTEKQGPSKARNLGTRLSKGEFIQYLDADDLLANGKLKIQLDALEKSGADVAYGDWQKLVKGPDEKYIKKEEIRKKLLNPEIDLFTDFWCPVSAYLFRRSIVEKVGWDESYPLIEDARFVFNCTLYRAKFVYCEGIMAYYRMHPDSLSLSNHIVFVRCCLRNAIDTEKWWQDHGGITQERRKALLKVYEYITQESFKKDKPTFDYAHTAINKLASGYIPFRNKFLRLICRYMGYRAAALISFWCRSIKNIIHSFY